MTGRPGCRLTGVGPGAVADFRGFIVFEPIVTEVVAYRTILEDAQREGDPDVYGMLLDGKIDVATFTSPSAIRNFAKIHGADQVADLLKNTVVATIGPVTADAARQLGIPVTIQPKTYTVPALVEAIAAHYAGQSAEFKARGVS